MIAATSSALIPCKCRCSSLLRGVPRQFYIKQIVLGKDEDGNEISSCVLVEAENEFLAEMSKELSDTEKIVKALTFATAKGDEVTRSTIAELAGMGYAKAKPRSTA
jgi:hypothetical protein